MARTRALLTERDRELIAGINVENENRRYNAISEVKTRIQEELPVDIAVMEEHHTGLLNEVHKVVCDDQQVTQDPIQTLKALSQQLGQPIIVGEQVFEDGDVHPVPDEEEVTPDE